MIIQKYNSLNMIFFVNDETKYSFRPGCTYMDVAKRILNPKFDKLNVVINQHQSEISLCIIKNLMIYVICRYNLNLLRLSDHITVQ